jgi:arsenical pump membrane protein
VLIVRIILAVVAVGSGLLGPRSACGIAGVVAAAAVDAALGAPVGSALRTVAPLACFLTAALTLAAMAERSGLMARVASTLVARARGSALRLYGLVCTVCAVLTAAVSLDGAIVLMVPLLVSLQRRFEAPFAPLFLGSVAVANAASIAVPQGNPTNLVVIERLGISPAAFAGHMVGPGTAAAVACATCVAVRERAALRCALVAGERRRGPLSSAERHAAVSLGGVTVATWAATAAGISPMWPFAGAVVLALVARRSRARPLVPWRLTAQLGALLVVFGALAPSPVASAAGMPGLLALAAAIGAFCALVNNLPVGAWAAGVLATGPAAYAASIGLGVGALATRQGSVATLLAADLAGPSAPPLGIRALAPVVACGVLTATLLLQLTL